MCCGVVWCGVVWFAFAAVDLKCGDGMGCDVMRRMVCSSESESESELCMSSIAEQRSAFIETGHTQLAGILSPVLSAMVADFIDQFNDLVTSWTMLDLEQVRGHLLSRSLCCWVGLGCAVLSCLLLLPALQVMRCSALICTALCCADVM